MNEFIIDYCLNLLNKHYKYYINYHNEKNPNEKTQLAFYMGAFVMLENVVSDRYLNDVCIERSDDGKHKLTTRDDKLPF